MSSERITFSTLHTTVSGDAALWTKFKQLSHRCQEENIESTYYDKKDPKQNLNIWRDAFDALLAFLDTVESDQPNYRLNLDDLEEHVDFEYPVSDWLCECLHEFRYLPQRNLVHDSCLTLLTYFPEEGVFPCPNFLNRTIISTYREQNQQAEAFAFSKEWYAKDETNLSAAAAFIYDLCVAGQLDLAKSLIDKHIPKRLICDNQTYELFQSAVKYYQIVGDDADGTRIRKAFEKYRSEHREILMY